MKKLLFIFLLFPLISLGQSMTYPDNPKGTTLTDFHGGVQIDGYAKAPRKLNRFVGIDSTGQY